MNSDRVCAIILTFNSVERITRSLNAVREQSRAPDLTLVVDNHSTDGTEQYLESIHKDHPNLVVVRSTENLGPAGGFHLGMSTAYDQGYGFLWLLDDDSVPETRCLEILLSHLGSEKHKIAWPLNIDENNQQSQHPAWRGELVPREVVERGGLPNKDLFWGVEDTEYFVGRLKEKHQIGRINVRDAVVRFTQGNERKNATWHYYYRSRNMVYYRLWVQQPRRIRKLMLRLFKLWSRAVIKEKQKFRKSIFMILGIYHGLRGRIGKTIEPE